jgi:hypothetical protein
MIFVRVVVAALLVLIFGAVRPAGIGVDVGPLSGAAHIDTRGPGSLRYIINTGGRLADVDPLRPAAGSASHRFRNFGVRSGVANPEHIARPIRRIFQCH